MRLWPRKKVYVDQLPRTHDLRFGALFVVLVVALLGGVYAVGFFVAGDRLPPGTSVAGVDVGGMRTGEARNALQDKLIPRLSQPIRAEALGHTFTIDPQRAGLTFDLDATIHAGLGGERWDPRHMLRVVMGGDPLAPVVDVNHAELTSSLRRIASRVERRPVDATVTFPSGQPVATSGQPGLALDYGDAGERLKEALLNGDGAITLPVGNVEPDITSTEAASFVAEVARPAVTRPVRIRVADLVLTVQPRQFASALRARAQHGMLLLDVDAALLQRRTRGLIASLPHDPISARVVFRNGRPRVQPSRSGVTVTQQDWADALLTALRRGGDPPRATAKAMADNPPLTTSDVRQLGIRERIASSDLPVAVSINPKAVARVAARLDGALVRPGAVFSFLDRAGARDPGAASVVASATYAAAFKAGMGDLVRTDGRVFTHGSLPGLDASVAAPDTDLQWRNGTPYGVYVRTRVADGGAAGPDVVHVQLWSTPFLTVRTHSSRRHDVVPQAVHRVTDRSCRRRHGTPGFTFNVTRIFVRGGERRRVETSHSSYAPVDAIVCVRRRR